jgi:hypothetical protein
MIRAYFLAARVGIALEVALARLRPGPVPERCAGFGHRSHHVDGPLIRTNLAPDMEMCRPCWRRWAATDRKAGR